MARLPVGFSKRSDGSLTLRFTINGKRFQVYGRSIKECRTKELAKREEIAKGIEQRKNPTVQQYVDQWLDNRQLHIKESTFRGQRQILNSVILKARIDSVGKHFGEMKISEVTADDVKQIQAELRKDRKTQTVNDYIALLGHVFRDAVNERVIDYNCLVTVKPLKRTEVRARDAQHRALTIEEQTAFFSSERTKRSWYYNVYRLAVCSGLRVGEIGALTYADVANSEIRVNKTITRTDSGSYKIGDTPKTDAGNRIVPFTPEIAEIMEEQKKRNRNLYGNVTAMNDLVFKAVEGGLLMSTPVNREIKRICKEIGIEPFSMHGFRDTFCTRCIESNMNPKTLQTIAGHSSFNITMSLYGHCMKTTAADELNRVSIVC